ncbi:MAG: hypothetical protein IBX63_09970, partial [Coriobacteriia bacterium]|nr:hypothetical protein [Coriobacteriia bacterium]
MSEESFQESLGFGSSDLGNEDLCLELLRADSEIEVVRVLSEAGYWDDDSAWTAYGGNENNFSFVGNQQASPEAALVEKLVNSVDAVLMRECLIHGIDPEGPAAPKTTKDALKTLFDIKTGSLAELPRSQRRELSENIRFVSTGSAAAPCYTVIDSGEGQSPATMPDTLLSLGKSNKLRIPFVQGKFNMGSAGALQFCSPTHNLQLIVSKRDSRIADAGDVTSDYWSFTILRRVEPRGSVRNSTYKYLAPEGELLSFAATSIPAAPGAFPIAYGAPLHHGTVVKLYEYQMPKGLRTDIRRELFDRLSVLLPEVALPVRLCERRSHYSGKTMEVTLGGLSVKLDEDAAETFEHGFPASATLRVRGQEIRLKIYAFKPGMKDRYARREGIIFVIQGQAHGALDRSFFTRQTVGMSYLDQSLLVLADCSDIDSRNREDLFMNSRDRLRETALKHEIEAELTTVLAEHPGLRQLRERRRQDEIESRIGDSKPLADVLAEVIRNSPVLSRLLLEGRRLSNPFGLMETAQGNTFEGKRFPSFFQPEKEFPDERPKHCPHNRRFRLAFETDAANDYFDREVDPGEAKLLLEDGSPVADFTLNLWNGRANLSAQLRGDRSMEMGELIRYRFEVNDCSRIMPFDIRFAVMVDPAEEPHAGGRGDRHQPPG